MGACTWRNPASHYSKLLLRQYFYSEIFIYGQSLVKEAIVWITNGKLSLAFIAVCVMAV